MSIFKPVKHIIAVGALLSLSQAALAYQPYHPFYPPQPAQVALMPPQHFQPQPYFPVFYRPAPYAHAIPANPLRPIAEPESKPQAAPVVEEKTAKLEKIEKPSKSEPIEVKQLAPKVVVVPAKPVITESVKQVEIVEKPTDTAESVVDSKQAFLNKLEPIVVAQNQRLMLLRERVSGLIDSLDSGQVIDDEAKKSLRQLARKYRVKGNPLSEQSARRELLSKIDIIPLSLALAQAVNESAWGTSRFAREGNNLFGIWTYDKTKGIVPKRRAEGAAHLVRKFESLDESVAYYMFTLNSHPAYAKLRELRAEYRSKGELPDGIVLAAGLLKYSAKGEEYVRLIRDIIHRYDLALRAMSTRA